MSAPTPQDPAPLPRKGEPWLPAFAGFLGLRFLAIRKINLIGVVGIGVAVWAMIFVVALFSGFISDIRESVRRASPDLLLTSLPTDISFDELDARLREDDDVVATAPRLRHYALYFPYGGSPGASGAAAAGGAELTVRATDFQFVELTGVDPVRERTTTGLLDYVSATSGDDPSRLLQVPAAAVRRWRQDAGLPLGPGVAVGDRPAIVFGAPRAFSADFRLGQRLSVVSASFHQGETGTDLATERQFLYVGGLFETGHRVFDQTKALLDIDVLRADMLGYDPYIDPLVVSDVAIRVRDGADLDSVAARIESALQGTVGGICLTWEAQNQIYLDAVDQERALMKLVLIVVLLVSAFLVYVTLTMMVAQKTREIGILASLGASQRGVLKLFLFTGGVIAVIGCTLGTLAGHLSVAYANDVDAWARAEFGLSLFPANLYALDAIPFHLDPWWSVQVVCGALAVAFLATWLPARRAARLQPVRALAHE